MTLAYMDRIRGWAIIQQKLGDPVSDHEPKFVIHERRGALIESLPTLQHDSSQPEDVLKLDCDDEGTGGDDDADASRYLVASKRRSIVVKKLSGL